MEDMTQDVDMFETAGGGGIKRSAPSDEEDPHVFVRQFFTHFSVKDGLVACFKKMKERVTVKPALHDVVVAGATLNYTEADKQLFEYEQQDGTILVLTTGGICNFFLTEHAN